LIESLKHQDSVLSAQFSPDGKRVVTASDDGTARLWEAHTGQPLGEPLQHRDKVSVAQFSPDGERVVTASADKTARVWNGHTGQALTEPLEHDSTVHSAQFSPNGKWVVTASYGGTARAWDARTGQPVGEPMRHAGAVRSVEFSPDGRFILTASADGTARLWDLPVAPPPVPEWLPQLAEGIAGRRLNEEGSFGAVPTEEWLALRKTLLESSATDRYTRWAKWLLGEKTTRTISPFSDITVPEYVQHRIEENTLPSLREAVALSPTNTQALATLARLTLAEDPEENPRGAWEADFYSRRAVEVAPESAGAWQVRADVLRKARKLPQALEAINRAMELAPKNPDAAKVKSELLKLTGDANRESP